MSSSAPTAHPLDAPHVLAQRLRMGIAILSPGLFLPTVLVLEEAIDWASGGAHLLIVTFLVLMGIYQWGVWQVRLSTGTPSAIAFWACGSLVNAICSLFSIYFLASTLFPTVIPGGAGFNGANALLVYAIMIGYTGALAVSSIYFILHELRIRRVVKLEEANEPNAGV